MSLLLRGGYILSMDPDIGDIPEGDVLIEGDRVAAVGPRIEAPEAEVMDARNRIVMPGLINAHQHTWQTGLRGTCGDWSLGEYLRSMHATTVPLFHPDDIFLANYVGAVNQLNCGTTTLFDWHHCNATVDHTDAAIDGLEEAGIRAVYGHGTTKTDPLPGEPPFSEIPHPRDRVQRLRMNRLSSDDDLITMAMCILGPNFSVWDVTSHDVKLARELGVGWSCHSGAQGVPSLSPDGIRRMADAGLLGPDGDFVHANNYSDEELKLIIDHGASITSTPECEYQFGHGNPVTDRVLALGGSPAFGVDVETSISGDMFTVLRMGLQIARGLRADRGARPTATVTISAREALEWGTIGNARAMGLESRTGSLTPGKQADIILVRTDDLNLFPVHDPVQTLLFMSSWANVDTVLVAGRFRKKAGTVCCDQAVLRDRLDRLEGSGRRILHEAGVHDTAG